MQEYFYSQLRKYLSLYILPQNVVVEIDPMSSLLVGSLPNGRVTFRPASKQVTLKSDLCKDCLIPIEEVKDLKADYLVLCGVVHYESDIQGLLASVRDMCAPETRLIVTYYSGLWRPLAKLASALKLRRKLPEANWLSHEDIHSLFELEDFELVGVEQKILVPVYIPLISCLLNRFVAPLPIFRNFCLVNISIARPIKAARELDAPSVSIVIPARNEAGNIDTLVNRIPRMGPDDEIIFVEGNSTDNTWDTIRFVQKRHESERRIKIAQQTGKGKGDAVRTGFNLATNEILMILDADLSVAPEDLPKFYNALRTDKGEFINGSRLVYPMQGRAMRFINLLGNKFFALAFSFVLGQRFKDTLCGTKVISRRNYLKLQANRSFFGEFDPFGDFDLIFGAARMALKIVEVPICYRERTYGETNISRWRHGLLLLVMLIFAARKIKFI